MRNLKKHVSDPIPSDLLIDIFSRVPTKTIARFRCVSKSWASIIRCPDFADQFMTLRRFLFTFEEDGKLFFSSCSPQIQNPDKNSSHLVVDHVAYFPTDVPYQICRPINGLICRQYLKKTESVTVVYNLSTGDTVTLPEVRTEIKSRSYFGYDPIEKQFKVLSMTWSQEHRVLTLGNGKQLWRKVELCRPHNPLYDGICIKGFLDYPAEEKRCCGVSMIVCFNVRSEKFNYINIDEDMVIKCDSALINYKGILGLFQDIRHHPRRNKGIGNGRGNGRGNGGRWKGMDFLLWILEDAAEHKWSKHFYKLPYQNFKYGEPVLHFVGLTATGELLFSPYFLYDPFYIVYYNLEKKTTQKVQIRGLEAFKKLPKVHIFV